MPTLEDVFLNIAVMQKEEDEDNEDDDYCRYPKRSRKDYYYSGILASNLNSYDDAIASFTKVIGTDDELSQSAHYHMANCYLQMKNKVTAMEQFRLAGEKDFDPVIKEDACFNYAKLTFDINSDISQFTEYLEKYPDQGKEDIINGYMADSFLLSKDYRSAVDILVKIKFVLKGKIKRVSKLCFRIFLSCLNSVPELFSVPVFLRNMLR